MISHALEHHYIRSKAEVRDTGVREQGERGSDVPAIGATVLAAVWLAYTAYFLFHFVSGG